MKWIVGLGNPGNRYTETRHNVGFMAVDRFAEKAGISMDRNQCKASIGEGMVNGCKVVLIKPMTYMNLSGESVRAYMDYYKAAIDELIVVYDDLDTNFGRIRLRLKGSSGGHNGIKSLIQHVGTSDFNRIRIGISRPPEGWNVVNYVLSDFGKDERKQLDETLEVTSEVLFYSLDHSFEQVMSRFNE